ncbi:MAG: ROK family protein [Hyphomicrobiaceae bacterium]
MTGWRLLADVGGTNARFARGLADGTVDSIKIFRTADIATFEEALGAYLSKYGGPEDCEGAAIAAAGPVDDGVVVLTNGTWRIDVREIANLLPSKRVVLLNDLEAVAAALRNLRGDELAAIGPLTEGQAPTRPMLAVNVGTGLGAACSLLHHGERFTLATEAGHVRLPLQTEKEVGLLSGLSTAECLLSGRGVVDLYTRLQGGTSQDPARPASDATSIFEHAGRDPAARKTCEMFTAMLGRFAGDLALVTLAWGGVYLCGSVAMGWSKVADAGAFREAFEGRGAMRYRLKEVPTFVILQDQVALHGLARLNLSTRIP